MIIEAKFGVHNYVGTAEYDYVDYRNEPGRIIVDLSQGTVTRSDGSIDRLTSIEGIFATAFDDIVISNGGPPWFGATVSLMAGNNKFVAGGSTEDALQYIFSPVGVDVDLAAGTAQNGFGGIDTIVGTINGVEPASMFDDRLLGNDAFNSFRPSGGSDYVDGRGGRNQVIYDNDPSGIFVDLSLGYAIDGYGGRDTLINIHQILGSDFKDTIILGGGDNYVDGRKGADVLDGGAGTDSFGFSLAQRAIYVDLGTGTVYDGTGSVDIVSNFEGFGGTMFNDVLKGSHRSETLIGDAGNDIFVGGGGDDVFIGGDGLDTVVYDIAFSAATFLFPPDGSIFIQHGSNKDFAREIETIQFANGSYDVSSRTFSPQQTGLIGNATNNRFLATSTNEMFDGAGGIDTAVLTGNRADYSITINRELIFTNGLSGADIFANVERFQFSDALTAFDLNGNAGDAYRIYQAAFDRTPDRSGLSYWVNQMDNGMPLSQVALNFILSPEFASTYGNINAMSNSQFVNVVYQNVLHRAPDTGGFNYWMNDLSNGYPRHFMLAAFSQSAENQANVASAIQNGILLDLGAFV